MVHKSHNTSKRTDAKCNKACPVCDPPSPRPPGDCHQLWDGHAQHSTTPALNTTQQQLNQPLGEKSMFSRKTMLPGLQ